jgi:Mn-dependent DtxR family transcriptional regulator
MSGERDKPNPNDPDLKKPLQKSDLIGPSVQSSDPDYQEAKERYSKHLEAILSTPLTPENFNTYADDALDSVAKMVEDMTRKYPGESLPLPRGRAEEYTAGYYVMDIDNILDSLQSKIDETNLIKQFVKHLSEENAVYVPPQSMQPAIQDGNGEFSKKETAPKLETILFLLQERYELEMKNSEEIKVTKGTVTKDMMREEPYYLVELPTLDRSILVCNEIGNITYVMDSTLLEEQGMEAELLVDLDKSQIDELIKTNQGLGVRITHTAKYLPKIELALESITEFSTKSEIGIESDDTIQEESLLKPAQEKAPEEYMSVKQIAKELGISASSVKNIIAGLDGLSPIKARFGPNVTDAYSPEEIAKIKDEAERMGLLTPEAAEGYMSIPQIAKELGISDPTVNKIITELGGLSPLKARFRNNVTDAYSPEDIARIKEEAERMGLFTPEAPEGYMSIFQISKELGISALSVRNIIAGLDGLSPIKARFGPNVTDAYPPEEIAKIKDEAERMGLFSPEAPEGYMSIPQIAKELGVGHRTVKNIIAGLGGLSPIKARFGPVVADAYSPEDIARIKEEAERMGLFSPESPEGYMSIFQISKELGISDRTVRNIIAGLDGLSPIKARFRNNVTDAYSPEEIAMIREGLAARRANKS